MYKRFFHLHSLPFNASPDPRFLFVMPQTQAALAGLEYGIFAHKGITVLTGEVGTGKTTLLRATLERFSSERLFTSFVFNPQLEPAEFLEYVLADFQLTKTSGSKAGKLLQLNRWLIDCYQHRETCVLIVDEAQNCSWELLEEIRLLTNLETASQKLLQIVLSGQPELEQKLRQPNARQLRQRVGVWCRTHPLTATQTAEYIEQRLRLSGSTAQIFPPDVVAVIHDFSGGIPRLINLMGENCLVAAYADQLPIVTAALAVEVARDLDPGYQPFAERPDSVPSIADASGLPAAGRDGEPGLEMGGEEKI